MSFVKNYLTNVCEIENFYDEDDAEKILEKFKKSQNWDHIIQKKPEHYSHVFKNDSIYMPDENEQYLSSFWRNDDLSNDQLIKEKTSLAIEKYFYELFKIKNLEIFTGSGPQFSQLFKLRGLPTTILIDKSGFEIGRIVGYVDFSDKNLLDWLTKNL